MSKIKTYTCVRCKTQFDQKSKYERHLNRKIVCLINKNNGKVLPVHHCKICNRNYARADSLARHLDSEIHKAMINDNDANCIVNEINGGNDTNDINDINIDTNDIVNDTNDIIIDTNTNNSENSYINTLEKCINNKDYYRLTLVFPTGVSMCMLVKKFISGGDIYKKSDNKTSRIAFYVITGIYEISDFKFKIGYHTGSVKKLLRRYATYFSRPIILYFIYLDDYSIELEDIIKDTYYEYREENCGGRKTEIIRFTYPIFYNNLIKLIPANKKPIIDNYPIYQINHMLKTMPNDINIGIPISEVIDRINKNFYSMPKYEDNDINNDVINNNNNKNNINPIVKKLYCKFCEFEPGRPNEEYDTNFTCTCIFLPGHTIQSLDKDLKEMYRLNKIKLQPKLELAHFLIDMIIKDQEDHEFLSNYIDHSEQESTLDAVIKIVSDICFIGYTYKELNIYPIREITDRHWEMKQFLSEL